VQNIIEFFILFDLTLFFMVFSLIVKFFGEPYLTVIFRFLSMIMWFILGIFYTGITSPLVPAAGWVFYVVGVGMMLILFKDAFTLWYQKKWGERD